MLVGRCFLKIAVSPKGSRPAARGKSTPFPKRRLPLVHPSDESGIQNF
jgi:hypothetical protein